MTSIDFREGYSRPEKIRSLLRLRKPFSVSYKNRDSVKIAFTGGIWGALCTRKDGRKEKFGVSEDVAFACESHILRGLLEEFRDFAFLIEDVQEKPVHVIEKTLNIWAGNHKDIISIKHETA